MDQRLHVPLWRKLITYFIIISLLTPNLTQAMEDDHFYAKPKRECYLDTHAIIGANNGQEQTQEISCACSSEEPSNFLAPEVKNNALALADFLFSDRSEVALHIRSYLDKKDLIMMRAVNRSYQQLVEQELCHRTLMYDLDDEISNRKVWYKYLTLTTSPNLIRKLYNGKTPHYRQKNGEIDLGLIYPDENLPYSLDKLFPRVAKVLNIDESSLEKFSGSTTYKFKLKDPDLRINDLYDRTCKGDIEAYTELQIKASSDALAAGLLLRYLKTVGKSIFATTLLPDKIQDEYLAKSFSFLIQLAYLDHPYAQDILAVLFASRKKNGPPVKVAAYCAMPPAVQRLASGHECLGYLLTHSVTKDVELQFLLDFKNGSLYAARKLAVIISSINKDLSLEIFKYAASRGDRDSLAEIGNHYERDNKPKIAFQYFQALILEDHVLGFYKIGMQWFKKWVKRKNNYELSLLAEEALYKFVRHFQIINSQSFIKESYDEGLLPNSYLKKSYSSLLVLWFEQLSDNRYQQIPVLTSSRKMEALVTFLQHFHWPQDEKNQDKWIKSFLRTARQIHKAPKSKIDQLDSRILPSIYLILQQFLWGELWNVLLSPPDNISPLPYPELLVLQIKDQLNVDCFKRTTINIDENYSPVLLVKYFQECRNFITLLSPNICSNVLKYENTNYAKSFYYLSTKILQKDNPGLRKQLLGELAVIILKGWDILLFPPHFSKSSKEIGKFLQKNQRAYFFILSILEEDKRLDLKLAKNLSLSEFSTRLRNIMLYTLNHSGNKQQEIKWISPFLQKVLTLLNQRSVLDLAAEFGEQDNKNTAVLSDVLLCAYYAGKGQNKDAYASALRSIEGGLFENISIILNAPWISHSFRKKFFQKVHPELEKMVKTHNIPIPHPEALYFISTSYYSGSPIFPHDPNKAYWWYQQALAYGSKKGLYSLGNILGGDNEPVDISYIESMTKFYEELTRGPSRYVAQLHLARLYVEEGRRKKQENYYKKAFFCLSESLSKERIGAKKRKHYYWIKISGEARKYHFSEIEESLLAELKNDSNPLCKRGQAAYDLACLHMWGGYKQEESLYKTLYYFSLALNMGISQSDLFLTVVRYHLAAHISDEKVRSKKRRKAWYQKALQDIAPTSSGNIQPTLDIQTLSKLTKKDVEQIMNKFDFYCQNGFAYMGLLPVLCYKYGIVGVSRSLGDSIEWLRKTAPHDKFASFFLQKMYPTFQILQDRELKELLKRRIYPNERPTITIIGGGITGIMSALLIAQLKRHKTERIPLFDIHLVEKAPQLFDGASKLISRLHLGGEYPKHEQTARQCLLSAVLFRQMFQTELFLTQRKAIDFLVAKASHLTPRENNNLTSEKLEEQYNKLKLDYEKYYNALKNEWQEETDAKLFGSPEDFVQSLSEEDIKELNMGPHFAAGLHTPERGFQPVGMGVLLEYLLNKQPNITIHRSSEVSHIEPLGEEGFRLEVSSPLGVPSTFYTRYLVNAAWAGVPYINSLVKRSPQESNQQTPKTKIFLRSIALIDISDCKLPADRSFFGLIGDHGGMLSCFNSKVASLFIPGEGLSYQGEYTLNEDSSLTNIFPLEAREHYDKLSNTDEKMEVAEAILKNAQQKYEFLKNARVIDLITRTTLTRDEELHQRQHDNVRWVDASEKCLEAYSPKGSFSIFTGLQVIAQLLHLPEFGEAKKCLSKKARSFLKSIKKGINFKGDQLALKTAILPEDFILVKSKKDLPSEEKTKRLALLYGFQRNLTYTLIEENKEELTADMDSAAKFKAIDWQDEIDLEHHILTPELVKKVLDRLGKGNIKHLKLGKVVKEKRRRNSDGDESGEYNIEKRNHAITKCMLNLLKKASEVTTLESLSLHDWDLNFKDYTVHLKKLLEKLKSFTLIKGSLSNEVACEILSKESKIQMLTFSDLTDSSIPINTIIGRIKLLPNIQELKIYQNGFDLAPLEEMIAKQPSLKRLSLRGKVSSLPSSSPLRKEIDAQLSRAQSLLLAIINANNLEYVDLGGNKELNLVQEYLDYHFYSKDKTATPLSIPLAGLDKGKQHEEG